MIAWFNIWKTQRKFNFKLFLGQLLNWALKQPQDPKHLRLDSLLAMTLQQIDWIQSFATVPSHVLIPIVKWSFTAEKKQWPY